MVLRSDHTTQCLHCLCARRLEIAALSPDHNRHTRTATTRFSPSTRAFPVLGHLFAPAPYPCDRSRRETALLRLLKLIVFLKTIRSESKSVQNTSTI